MFEIMIQNLLHFSICCYLELLLEMHYQNINLTSTDNRVEFGRLLYCCIRGIFFLRLCNWRFIAMWFSTELLLQHSMSVSMLFHPYFLASVIAEHIILRMRSFSLSKPSCRNLRTELLGIKYRIIPFYLLPFHSHVEYNDLVLFNQKIFSKFKFS